MSRYTLEDVLKLKGVEALSDDDKRRVAWAYNDTYAAYEENVPYSHARLPGIAGVAVYQLNKEITAYASAVREAERLMKGGKSDERT